METKIKNWELQIKFTVERFEGLKQALLRLVRHKDKYKCKSKNAPKKSIGNNGILTQVKLKKTKTKAVRNLSIKYRRKHILEFHCRTWSQ